MAVESKERFRIGRQLMDDFAQRTGLIGQSGDIRQRYLWTDALAVHTFFNLSHVFTSDVYCEHALKLIDEVHLHLARFHPADNRKGWISGLSEQQGQKHPTAGGLRIGKKLLERKPGEPFNERLEWERDGQYFHYLTRWMQALLQAEHETHEKKYALWAFELLEAATTFIDKTSSPYRIYWKMSTDLSRPLVRSMGAHDPLEGLICALSILEKLPEKTLRLQPIIKDLKDCCHGLDWSTTDPLGIGGLMLTIPRLADIAKKNTDLPENLRAEKLLTDCFYGLERFSQMHHPDLPAVQRLAFRECGLSLGIRVLMKFKEKLIETGLNLNHWDRFIYLADEIESFWIDPKNQSSPTWIEHLDINAASLAASLVAMRNFYV